MKKFNLKLNKVQQKKKIKSDILAEQNWHCAWCFRGAYCAACANNLIHKGNSCHYQFADQLDHNHACCKTGCPNCYRGVVHPFCNREIGYIENTPHLQNKFIKNYLKRGKPKTL